MPKIGLALGGGGVRGFAHIPVLETLDELDCRPAAIAGCSMGAVMGALYAAGMSGANIRELVTSHTISKKDSLRKVLNKRTELFKMAEGLRPDFGGGGLVKADRLIAYLVDRVGCETFEQLPIPLSVVAADYASGEEVVLDSGDLVPAVLASMAVPGVFAPVAREDRVLVDGGVVNLVPYNVLRDSCDMVIAVDVSIRRTGDNGGRKPRSMDIVLAAFDILQRSATATRLKLDPPDILVRPDIRNVRMLDFSRVDVVLEAGAAAAQTLRGELASRLEEKT